MIRIIGIDPGLRCTGYGVIESDGYCRHYIASGQIRPKPSSLPERIGELYRGLMTILIEHQPQQAAIETCFVAKNVGTTLKLGQARGALISACVGQQIELFEYSPRHMKLAVTGQGAANKDQVQFMVCQLLEMKEPLQSDESDALGLAICHAHQPTKQGAA